MNVDHGLTALVERARRFVRADQWNIDRRELSRPRALGLRTIRIVSLAWQRIVERDVLTHASALTYISVLSLVPMLAFAFSVAKGFGAYDYLRATAITPFLDRLTPAGADAQGATAIRAVAERVLDFVSRTSFANLGVAGLLLLIFAALRLLMNVESSLNLVWDVHDARSLTRKVTDFVALVVVSPLLVLVASAVTATLASNSVTEFLSTTMQLGPVVRLGLRLLPLLTVWLGFAFLYLVMPNTPVPIGSAVIGGIVGGTIWEGVQVLYIQLQVGVANYNAIYASFAAIPIFLVWVYMNWAAVLVGGVVGWAHHMEPLSRQRWRLRRLSFADRELIAVRALGHLAASFDRGAGATPLTETAAACGVLPGILQDVLQPLVAAGLVARTGPADGLLLPARPLHDIRVGTVLRTLRGTRQPALEEPDAYREALDGLNRNLDSLPHNHALLELTRRSQRKDQFNDDARLAAPSR